jgi:uncharacterized protein (UPF0332 family)
MKDATQQLMLNAEETLNAAQVWLDEDYLRDAVNRAYYAVFYIAEALLNEKDIRFKKHGAVHGAFAQQYIKTGLFDAKYHRLVLTAFGKRMLGDYDEAAQFKAEEVKQTIAEAQGFLQAAKDYLAAQN